MSVALNNVTTADNYTDANTLKCPGTAVVNLTISGAAVLLQYGQGWPMPVWDPDEYVIPLIGSFDRQCDAVRFKSAVKGTPAQVTAMAKGDGEAHG